MPYSNLEFGINIGVVINFSYVEEAGILLV